MASFCCSKSGESLLLLQIRQLIEEHPRDDLFRPNPVWDNPALSTLSVCLCMSRRVPKSAVEATQLLYLWGERSTDERRLKVCRQLRDKLIG